MFYGNGYYISLGNTSPMSIVTSKPADEVLTGAMVRNVSVDGVKVTVCRGICVFEQALREVSFT